MAAKLLGIIPKQNYEFIRDRFGRIFKEELDNQFALSGEDALNVDKVYINRFKNFDKEECPVINISLWKGDYGNKSQRSADGTYMYCVDLYCSAPDRQDVDGDTQAQKDLERLMGACRAIIENPVYNRLDFINPGQPGYVPGGVTVSSVKVLGFQTPKPEEADTENMVRAQMIVEVISAELVELKTPVLLLSNATTVRLHNTEMGYYWGAEPSGEEMDTNGCMKIKNYTVDATNSNMNADGTATTFIDNLPSDAVIGPVIFINNDGVINNWKKQGITRNNLTREWDFSIIGGISGNPDFGLQLTLLYETY